MGKPFSNLAGFGKRMEYWVAGLMIKEGFDVYMPLVDDKGIDIIVRRKDETFVEVQVKARSKDVIMSTAASFGPIRHEQRNNYYFVFYSERLDMFWIMTSEEFIKESVQKKTGKYIGQRYIQLNGIRKNKKTGEREEHCKPQFEKYIAKNFSRLADRDSVN